MSRIPQFRPPRRHPSLVHRRAAHHRAPRKPRARLRRAQTVCGALGVTLLGAVLPGAGLLWTGRLVGYLLLTCRFVGPEIPDIAIAARKADLPDNCRGKIRVRLLLQDFQQIGDDLFLPAYCQISDGY